MGKSCATRLKCISRITVGQPDFFHSSLCFDLTAASRFQLLQAMSVVLVHATYLPAAQCFALLPLVGGFCRTGSDSGASLDYDLERQAVTVVARRPYRCDTVGV